MGSPAPFLVRTTARSAARHGGQERRAQGNRRGEGQLGELKHGERHTPLVPHEPARPQMRSGSHWGVPDLPAAWGVRPGSAGTVTRTGERWTPEATPAATSAMASGLTCTPPWPMVSSASAASPPEARSDPGKAAKGSFQCAPRPNAAAAAASWLPSSLRESPVNAVAQASAKSVLKGGCAPRAGSAGTLIKVCPPTSVLLVHGMGESTGNPLDSRASVEMIVKACPG